MKFTLFNKKKYYLSFFRFFSCAACEDNSLPVFNTIGQKLLPNLVLSSLVSILDANGHDLLAITQKGGLYVW